MAVFHNVYEAWNVGQTLEVRAHSLLLKLGEYPWVNERMEEVEVLNTSRRDE